MGEGREGYPPRLGSSGAVDAVEEDRSSGGEVPHDVEMYGPRVGIAAPVTSPRRRRRSEGEPSNGSVCRLGHDAVRGR